MGLHVVYSTLFRDVIVIIDMIIDYHTIFFDSSGDVVDNEE